LVTIFTLMAVIQANGHELNATVTEWVTMSVDLSKRVYQQKNDDGTPKDGYHIHKSNETYYLSDNEEDAAIVAVGNDVCYIAMRGTDNEKGIEVMIRDWLQNANQFEQKDVTSRDGTSTCKVGDGFYKAYLSSYHQALEQQIQVECVEEHKKLILTGHSQGTAVAQIAAVRFQAHDPFIITFAPAPTFFGECTAFSQDDQIINFVNTQVDGMSLFRPVQYDPVPFVEEVVPSFLVGSYLGPFYILNPMEEYKPSAAYVKTRQEILDTQEVDLSKLDAVQTHSIDEYRDKINTVVGSGSTFVADGFKPFDNCNPNSKFMCGKGFCIHNYAGKPRCSLGKDGEPCESDGQCNSGRCIWDWGIFDYQCITPKQHGESCLSSGECASGLSCIVRCRDGRNGDPCIFDSDCDSGRCDTDWNGKHCKQRKEHGEWCISNSDCQSNSCSWRYRCK